MAIIRGRSKDAAEVGSTEDAAELPTEGDDGGDISFAGPLDNVGDDCEERPLSTQ